MFHLIAEVPVRSLKVGQRFTGIIRDIGNFGLFVDVGAQRDGLVRYSTHQGGAGCSCRVFVLIVFAEMELVFL